jgi:hypothetical protein
VIVAVILVAFVVRKAREELDRAVDANEQFIAGDINDSGFEVIFMNEKSANR